MRFDPLLGLVFLDGIAGGVATGHILSHGWPAKILYYATGAAAILLWPWVVERQRMGVIEASVTWGVLFEIGYVMGLMVTGSRASTLTWCGMALGTLSTVLLSLGQKP